MIICVSLPKMFLYTGHFNVIQEKINCNPIIKHLLKRKKTTNYTMIHFDLNGK